MPLKTDVKLTIECEEIASLDWMSKSDPMCILNCQDSSGNWVKVGHTEWQKDQRNPKFVTKIKMEYTFEVKQKLQFVVVDVDDPNDLSNVNELGKIECTMGQIAGARHCKLSRELQGPKPGRKYGHITVFAEEMQGRTSDLLMLTMKGTEILNKDGFLGKSDPYLIVKGIRSDGETVEVSGGKSNVIDNTETPEWSPMQMNFIEVCNGKLDNKIRIECWDSDPLSKDDQIGVLDTSVAELLKGEPLAMKDYKEGRDLKPGFLTCASGGIVRIPTFLDYLGSGCEITVSFAIDFTMSNKDPAEEESLHSTAGEGYNQYQQAMVSVGEVLENYDHDKKFAVLGYGGIPPGKDEADHCFALNMDDAQPEVEGVQGLLSVYASALDKVKLYGPTNFSDVIRRSTMLAKECSKQHYHVLTIITDGDITDMQPTINNIITASYEAPMSIVIVGVGEEDFAAMEALDADRGGLIDDDGKGPARDIVQFVPYKEAAESEGGVSQKLLEEIPRQLLEYMSVNKKAPPRWSAADASPEEKLYRLPEGNWAPTM